MATAKKVARAAPADDALDLAALVQDAANRRSHNERNLTMIRDALRDVGAARSIVIDEGNVILAGNGVATAAAAAGLKTVRIIDAEGDELVAVRRRDLSPEKKRALAIYDNRTSELAEWNTEQLRADLAAGQLFEPFFTADELARLVFDPSDVVTDPQSEWKQREMPPYEMVAMAHRALVVYFKTPEDVEAFSNLVGQVFTPKTKSIWYPEKTEP